MLAKQVAYIVADFLILLSIIDEGHLNLDDAL